MRIMALGTITAVLFFPLHAANSIETDDLGAKVEFSTFEASLGIGFNYDMLRDPFDVSFEYPKGYFGLNLPIEKNVNVMDYRGQIDEAVDSMITKNESMFSNLDEFRPTVGARQNPNSTIRVDVPMIGGVATFSSTQNFYINYHNVLGNPNVFMNPPKDSLMEGMSLLIRGTINVPIDVTASWETMTFGYAFEVNRLFKLAINLNRHVFYLDMRGKIDVDLLGRFDYEVSSGESEYDIPPINGEIDYSSDKISGSAYGHYETDVWTPTLAFKAWRFSFVSRFGISTKVHGSFLAKYILPPFVDPVTFNTKEDSEMIDAIMSNETDSIVYSSRQKTANGYRESDLEWEMPTGLTFGFDIIPDKIKVSYTKLFGEISMKLDRIAREQIASDTETTRELLNDSLIIDYGVSVDNIMVMEIKMFNSFLNLGIFSMDLRYADSTHLIGNELPQDMKFGDAALLPIVSLGTAFGTKMQLLLELDILPLPAVKTGLFYYF